MNAKLSRGLSVSEISAYTGRSVDLVRRDRLARAFDMGDGLSVAEYVVAWRQVGRLGGRAGRGSNGREERGTE